MNEQQIAEQIGMLVNRLNEEFKTAFQAGLRVEIVSHSGTALRYPREEQLSVRVYKQTELVNVPAPRMRTINAII